MVPLGWSARYRLFAADAICSAPRDLAEAVDGGVDELVGLRGPVGAVPQRTPLLKVLHPSIVARGFLGTYRCNTSR